MTHLPTEDELVMARIRLHHFINSPAYLGQDEVTVPLTGQSNVYGKTILDTVAPLKSITFKRVIDNGLPVWIVKMLIALAFFFTSCSIPLNLTPAQKAQKNFNRFRPRQDESRLAQIVGFTAVGLGLYYNNNVRTNKP